MRQDFRYSVHMMPNKSNWTCKNVKSAEFLQIQNDNKKKKRVAGLDGLKAMT